MRPWKVVAFAAGAALLVTAAMLWPALSATRPAGIPVLLLPHLPAILLTLIALYALAAIVATVGGLLASAVELRGVLDRIGGAGTPAVAAEWIAAFDATPLRRLLPAAGAFPDSSARRTSLWRGTGFDPRAARAEAVHLYYIWLARTHCLSALVALAAIAALGFAQARGAAPFVPAPIPAAPAVVVLTGLLLLVLLGRCAIDVTVDPVIDALSRLPGEPEGGDRRHRGAEPSEGPRLDTPTLGQRSVETPVASSEWLTPAYDDANRLLVEAGARLSAAADALASMARAAVSALEAIRRETRTIAQHALAGGGDHAERSAALQAAIEALTAELRAAAPAARVTDALGEDRRAFADAVAELSATAQAIGSGTRAAIEALAATLHDALAPRRGGSEPQQADAGRLGALQISIEALTAELQQGAAAERATAALDEDRRHAFTEAVAELSAAAQSIGSATRATVEALPASLRDGLAALRDGREPNAADAAPLNALQASIEALTAELQHVAAAERVTVPLDEDHRRTLSDAVAELSASAQAIHSATRAAVEALPASLRDGLAALRAGGEPRDADAERPGALQASIEALTKELQHGAAAERLAGAVDQDRRMLTDALEAFSAAAQAIGTGTRGAIDDLAATLRDGLAAVRTGTGSDGAGDPRLEALQTSVEGLTGELQQLMAFLGAARETPAGDAPAARTEVGRELRKLLEEI